MAGAAWAASVSGDRQLQMWVWQDSQLIVVWPARWSVENMVADGSGGKVPHWAAKELLTLRARQLASMVAKVCPGDWTQ